MSFFVGCLLGVPSGVVAVLGGYVGSACPSGSFGFG